MVGYPAYSTVRGPSRQRPGIAVYVLYTAELFQVVARHQLRICKCIRR